MTTGMQTLKVSPSSISDWTVLSSSPPFPFLPHCLASYLPVDMEPKILVDCTVMMAETLVL